MEKSYTYFPGCSLKGTGRAYEESLLAVLSALDVEVKEINDWNCCGATAYMAVDESKALALAARDLAIAEQDDCDLLVPCSGCFLVLEKTKKQLEDYPDKRATVSGLLRESGLEYRGKVKVRHPLDVILNDVGLEKIKERVKEPLEGLNIAPYYGCQIVRPYATFDHQTYPVTMDQLFEAVGATVVRYPLKTRCCGGSLTGTIPNVGDRLSYILLKEASKRGADTIATLCPLCQFNLDSYQDRISGTYEPVNMPVVYFTQILGLALGLSAKELGLHRHIISTKTLTHRMAVAT